jgi:probable FeS assembly SUF system protein SufT
MMAVLEREVPATIIPSGDRVSLPAGAELRVMQTLGGNITVQDPYGQLFRIDEKDGGALGEEYAPKQKETTGPAEFNEEHVWEQLRTVYDPEIPVNIVELGLVYACKSETLPEGGQRVDIQMTLTAPGCGMGEILVADVKEKVERIPTVREADVELTFDPPWNQSMMSEAARLQTGMF